MKSQKNFPQKNQLIYTTRVVTLFDPILANFLSFCSARPLSCLEIYYLEVLKEKLFTKFSNSSTSICGS